MKARCIYQVTCLIPSRLKRGTYLIFLQDDMGSLISEQLGSAHSLRNTAKGQEETVSRMQDAGSNHRHSAASDGTPHTVSEGGASLEDRKEATPKHALRTQWGLGHKSPASDRKQAAASLEGAVAHLGRHPDFQLEAQARGLGTLEIVHTAAEDVKQNLLKSARQAPAVGRTTRAQSAQQRKGKHLHKGSFLCVDQ